ncbi:hypothetical protein BGZ58_004699, partial [Dissophora ornata]
MPLPFNNHQHHHHNANNSNNNNTNNNNNNAGTPNNSFAGTIDPGLLQMTMNRMDTSQLQSMNSLFSSSSASSINSLGNNNSNSNNSHHPTALGRSGLGSKRNSNSNQTIKQETGSPDFLSSEMDFGEPGNMLSPGSSSPLNSPRNDFDSPDDFGSGGGGGAIASHAKPLPMNIQHQNSYGESPGNGSLYSPVESDFFPEGDFSLPTGTRTLDMKFGRHMHPGSLPNTGNPFHSMSMPVPRSDWFGAADGHAVGSFENPSGLQFGPGEMTGMMSSLFEDEGEQ